MKKCICSGLLILLILCLVACAVVEENYFSYLEKDFCAEVRGEMNGSAFLAVVATSRTESGYRVGVRYLFPATLSGLEVLAECNRQGVPQGVGSLGLEGRKSEVEAVCVAGLLLPICALLNVGEVESVQYVKEGCCLTLVDGKTLRLGRDGTPQFLRGDGFFLEVAWLEWSEGLNLVKK